MSTLITPRQLQELDDDVGIQLKNGQRLSLKELVSIVNNLSCRVAQLEQVVMEDLLMGKVDPKTET